MKRSKFKLVNIAIKLCEFNLSKINCCCTTNTKERRISPLINAKQPVLLDSGFFPPSCFHIKTVFP